MALKPRKAWRDAAEKRALQRLAGAPHSDRGTLGAFPLENHNLAKMPMIAFDHHTDPASLQL